MDASELAMVNGKLRKILAGHQLNDEEKATLKSLAGAWNGFVALDPPADKVDVRDFADGIHVCQRLIAFRVAQRVDPDVWKPDRTAVTDDKGCTSITARWCPIHGTCSCDSEGQTIEVGDMDDADCPLHGLASDHGKRLA